MIVRQAIVFAQAAADDDRASTDPDGLEWTIKHVSEFSDVLKSGDKMKIRQAYELWLGGLPRHQLRALEVLMYCGREGWFPGDEAYADVPEGHAAETIASKRPAGEYLAVALKRADEHKIDLDKFASEATPPTS